MAKKTREAHDKEAPAGVVMSARTEARLEEFAEDLGKLLGQAQNKAENWLGQRKAIAEHLTSLRDTATRLLAQLGIADAPTRPRAAKSAKTKRSAKAGAAPKKKRTMSAEARAKIAAAQRARWARTRK